MIVVVDELGERGVVVAERVPVKVVERDEDPVAPARREGGAAGVRSRERKVHEGRHAVDVCVAGGLFERGCDDSVDAAAVGAVVVVVVVAVAVAVVVVAVGIVAEGTAGGSSNPNGSGRSSSRDR